MLAPLFAIVSGVCVCVLLGWLMCWCVDLLPVALVTCLVVCLLAWLLGRSVYWLVGVVASRVDGSVVWTIHSLLLSAALTHQSTHLVLGVFTCRNKL